MVSNYQSYDPICRAESVTFDSEFSDKPVGLWIGAAGDVAIKAIDDSAARTYKAVPAGTLLMITVDTVATSGTTVAAADILALYNKRS